ncbi:MAG: hypothetical protein HZA16_12160 [Nitrospirae bacterium]|nr:hypothetical protein [Nitrospirota bacterium]
MKDKVVITGYGLVSSLGPNASDTWDALLSGRHGVRPIENFDARGFACKAAAQTEGIDIAGLGIHPRDARIMDKHSHMLLKAAQDAFKEAGADLNPALAGDGVLSADKIGFFAGMGMVDYNIGDLMSATVESLNAEGNLDYDAFYSGAYQDIYPLWPLSMLNNISFCQVAINLGIKGENTVFSPHADSGACAIIEGFNAVREGRAQAALAGGVSEKVSPLSLQRASWFEILNNEDMLCRPFGSERAGTVLGEGCGMIVLESLSSAKRRQVPYFAAVTGYACAYGKRADFNCPTSGAVSQAMEQALGKAGLKPSDIDLVIAHGDGTHAGDKNEMEAIHNSFSDCAERLIVYSSKGALGHMLAGSPAVDVILGIYMLRDGIIPAVCGALPPDKDVRFNVAGTGPVKKDLKRVLINATSYEGQCASMVIEKVD